MGSLALSLVTTCKALGGGSTTVTGTGADTIITVANTGGGDWLTGDSFTIIFTDATSGVQTQVGFGNVTGQRPTFAKTFNNKLYLSAGSGIYFSALAAPATFNDPNATGNDYILMGNQEGTAEDQMAIVPYQGLLAFVSRRNVQIWAIDPDPAQNAKQQILPNIGTMAKLSVQSIGDREVLMLADSGVRSLRPRVASLNAEPVDVGSPIDALVQASLVALTEAEKATACSIVEPSANRYMLYIPGHSGAVGKIYVLSSFPSSQIEAWTTYTPSYQVPITAAAKVFPVTAGSVYAWKPALAGDTLACGTVALTKEGIFTAPVGATTATVTGSAAGTLSRTQTFTPEKFSAYLGQVYVRAGDNVFQYGGSDNNTYDACGAYAQLPFLDADAPGMTKTWGSMDAGFQGTWQIGFCQDYNVQTFQNIYNNNTPTFQLGNIGINRKSSHFSMSFLEVSDQYARMSSIIMHFAPNQNA